MISARFDVASQVLAARWHIARLLPRAGIPLVSGLSLGNLVLGALPVVFIVETSIMLGRVPAAVRAGVGSAAWRSLVAAFIGAAAAFVLQQILAPLQAALGELLARRVDGRVFDQLMAASLGSPGIAPLEDQRVLDELSEASRDLEHGFQSPGKACAGLLALIARYGQLTGCVLVVGVAFSWLAALGVLAAVMVFRHGQRGGLRKYSQVFRRIAATRRKGTYLRDLAMQAPAGKEIRVFGLVGWLRTAYHAEYLRWLAPVWAERRRIYLRPYLWFTAFGLLATAAVFGGVGAAAGRSLSLTNLALVVQAALAAARLGAHYPEADTQTQFGMNAFDAVRRFERAVTGYPATVGDPVEAPVSRPETNPPDTARVSLDTGRVSLDTAPEIRFEGIVFGYPGSQRLIFDRLDLTVPAGRCTAIVGVNGAGKTTLVKLLARLYEPAHGAVRVAGADIRTLPVHAWRAQIGVIFQDFLRYEVSASDNIGFGSVEHLDDLPGVVKAASAAGIGRVLDRLPRGLDTPLARHLDGGAELSGGQWQRVALARALFALDHGSSVLVLDEPTASLDVRAEARFFDEFVSLTRGVTTILISHRFSTVRHADNIVVLEHGRVTEQGSHDELLARDGRYAELFRLQADRFTNNGDAAEDPDDLALRTEVRS